MWQYKHTDELYHYGVLGMKWGQRRAKHTPNSQNIKNKKSKHSDNMPTKKWSTNKKVAVGVAATAAVIAGAYGAKKFRDYIRNENAKIAIKNGEKYYTRCCNSLDWKRLYDLASSPKLNSFERSAAGKAQIDMASNAFKRGVSEIENVRFTQAVKNVMNAKMKK